jgi:hypothetical protein
VSRSQDGPRPFGALRHSGNAGISFGDFDPWTWNADAEAERQHSETSGKNSAVDQKLQRDRCRRYDKFRREFRTESDCNKHLATVRWPTGVISPCCDSAATLEREYVWQCNACKSKFTACAGTSIERSGWQLWVWYRAAFLILWNRGEHQSELSAERFATMIRVNDSEALRKKVGALIDGSPEIHTGSRDRDLRKRIAIALLQPPSRDG